MESVILYIFYNYCFHAALAPEIDTHTHTDTENNRTKALSLCVNITNVIHFCSDWILYWVFVMIDCSGFVICSLAHRVHRICCAFADDVVNLKEEDVDED